MPALPPDPHLPGHSHLLLRIRELRHWTQPQLAYELGISVRTLRNWERGVHDPHPRDLKFIRQLALNAAALADLPAS